MFEMILNRRAIPATRIAAFLFAARVLWLVFPSPGVAPTFAQSGSSRPRNIAGPGDYIIRQNLVERMGRDEALSQENFTLVLVNGGVVLSGPISSHALRLRVLRYAGFSRGVVNITDQLEVRGADLPDEALADAVRAELSGVAESLELENLEVMVEDSTVNRLSDVASPIRVGDVTRGR